MNQILYTEEGRNNQSKIKKTITFFSIFLIIFGIAIAGVSAYNIWSSSKKKEQDIELAKIPEITLENENNKVIVKVEHVRNLKSVVYSWDGGDEENININETAKILESIPVPAGTSTLRIKATDVIGKSSEMKKEFSYVGTYMDLAVIDNSKLKITVTDTKGLQSVKYSWNSEDSVEETAEDTNTKVMEIETAIPEGVNTIQVSAVNNENEKTDQEMTVQGITKPTIKITFNADRTLFTIKLDDNQGIEAYAYALYNAKVEDVAENGELKPNYKQKLTKVKANTVSGNGQLSIIDKIELKDGFNYIIVKVRNVEGVDEVFSGWCVK